MSNTKKTWRVVQGHWRFDRFVEEGTLLEMTDTDALFDRLGGRLVCVDLLPSSNPGNNDKGPDPVVSAPPVSVVEMSEPAVIDALETAPVSVDEPESESDSESPRSRRRRSAVNADGDQT